jgi:hypothetical protein
MVRTDRGPARALWAASYRLFARLVAALVATRESSVWLRGSVASGRPVYGLSDLDLILVAGDREAAERARARWRRLTALFPPARDLVFFTTYERAALERLACGTCRTHDPPPGPDELALASRPGLVGPVDGWRRIHGAGDLPGREPPRGPDRWLHAWPELQGWWSYAVRAVGAAPTRYTPYLAAKLIADPLRILLWIAHDEIESDRRRALRRAACLAPAYEESTWLALELLDGLGRAQPGAIDRVLPHLARISEDLAGHFAADAEAAGYTIVRLEAAAHPLPLCDWTALVAPPRRAEAFELLPGDPGSAAAVRSALGHDHPGRYPLLARGRLLVAATAERWPDGALRALNSPESDPVTFALLSGSREARFPRLCGWSAHDLVARAHARGGSARTAALRRSLAAGDPVLPVAPAEPAAMLAS